MTTIHQEIVPNSEHEAQEADRSSQESSFETTTELFRRDLSPAKHEPPASNHPPSPPHSPTSKTSSKPKSPTPKKESTTKKKSNSGIPLRLKTPAIPVKTAKTGSYRHSPAPSVTPTINRNTLEMQFINNKKRLAQLHTELLEKQRPLLEMHKSLARTKKQLEDMGKKVVLEDIKIISLKMDDLKHQMDGAGENPAAETAMNLKNSIENVLDSCMQVWKKCLVEREQVVKILESASKSAIEPAEIEVEVEELKRMKDELEKTMENTMKASEKKIDDVINNWQKSVKMRLVNEEVAAKIADLEDTIKQQQKSLQDADDNLHSITRKYEDKRVNYEKSLNEMQEKYNKLEDDLKKEKKVGNENLMKTRTMRGKVNELETRAKEAEEKNAEASTKLRQLQEQMRKKEIQWMKEKEELKKNEALLQQKFTERQSQFDTRLKDMEKVYKNGDLERQTLFRNFETQMEIKDQEYMLIVKERDALSERFKIIEEENRGLRKHLEEKEKEINELNFKAEDIPAIEYKPSESHWIELMEYKQKVTDAQNQTEQLRDQVSKMQSSLKAHAKLAAALKLEKDNAIKYSSKLRDVLKEAKDELDFRNKTIYKIHEKLVLKDKAYEKLKTQLQQMEACPEFGGDKWGKNRCQICMATMNGEKTENSSCVETEVGKSCISSPQYVSESLIGMSVKKVDHLRARLDNLKKMKLPGSNEKKFNVNYSWSHHSRESKPSSNLRKQIELRGKLYQILQKHADQSCEDFINLLKLTVSSGGKGTNVGDELKPSNMKDVDEIIKNPTVRQFGSNIKFSESFNTISEYINSVPVSEIYEKLTESPNSDTDEFVY